MVYNKQVENIPEYFADGVLVHNCGLCADLEGADLTIKQAEGLIPRHPMCRCSWTPIMKMRPETKTEKAETRKSILDSIQKERPKKTLKEAKAKSVWLGKERVRKKVSIKKK